MMNKMIITRAPLRIPLGGGGTDLPSYYQDHTGLLISAAINKYILTIVNEPIEKNPRFKLEKNSLETQALKLLKIDTPIEITTVSDIPAGTGLGYSGSFLVGLLRALHALKKQSPTTSQIAEEACKIEIELLGKPVGKQDQYIAAFGGIHQLEINKTGTVTVTKSKIKAPTLKKLEENLLIFYTGLKRNSRDVLKFQNSSLKKHNALTINQMHKIKQIGREIKQALEIGNLEKFGELLHIHWLTKKDLSKSVSSGKIDYLYDLGLKNGAIGGKVMGAGGGGFLAFYTPKNHPAIQEAMAKEGLKQLEYRFEFEGVKLISI